MNLPQREALRLSAYLAGRVGDMDIVEEEPPDDQDLLAGGLDMSQGGRAANCVEAGNAGGELDDDGLGFGHGRALDDRDVDVRFGAGAVVTAVLEGAVAGL